MTSNQQPQKIQIKNVVISYEDFLCCLKNIWISVKNNAQKQKCLKFFLKCVKTSFEKGCKIPWTYYINLAVHDLRVATLLVVTSAIFFVTTVILVEKCKQDQYDSFMEITRWIQLLLFITDFHDDLIWLHCILLFLFVLVLFFKCDF